LADPHALDAFLSDVSRTFDCSPEKISDLTNRYQSLKLSNDFVFPKQLKIVGYLPIHEEYKKFNLCMFALPKGTVLPLHDHPGQHVLLRVVFGELLVNQCDLSLGGVPQNVRTGDIVSMSSRNFRSFNQRIDDVPIVVSPESGNIHEIVALEDSIFMDLVMPPYDSERIVTYFKRVETDPGKLICVTERDMRLDMQMLRMRDLVTS